MHSEHSSEEALSDDGTSMDDNGYDSDILTEMNSPMDGLGSNLRDDRERKRAHSHTGVLYPSQHAGEIKHANEIKPGEGIKLENEIKSGDGIKEDDEIREELIKQDGEFSQLWSAVNALSHWLYSPNINSGSTRNANTIVDIPLQFIALLTYPEAPEGKPSLKGRGIKQRVAWAKTWAGGFLRKSDTPNLAPSTLNNANSTSNVNNINSINGTGERKDGYILESSKLINDGSFSDPQMNSYAVKSEGKGKRSRISFFRKQNMQKVEKEMDPGENKSGRFRFRIGRNSAQISASETIPM